MASPWPYHYIAVRRDLPVEKQLVHVAHAAGESVLVAPLSPETRVALFHAADEQELMAQAEKVRAAGFRVTVIHEPEGPEYGRGNVSFGVEPSDRHNKLRKLFHHMPLAKFDLGQHCETCIDQSCDRSRPSSSAR